MDKVSKTARSRIMSNIRGKDTKPELALRQKLFSGGLRYRKDYKLGNMRIDIAFVRRKNAVFVDGCFWHGCPTCYREPKSNRRYWVPKIKGNIRRDRKNSKILERLGWDVIRVWEHELKTDIEQVSDDITKRVSL
jgi:DNA mismatch endonuclease (patch repair protein)